MVTMMRLCAALALAVLAGSAHGQGQGPARPAQQTPAPDRTMTACVQGQGVTIDARLAACTAVLGRSASRNPRDRAVVLRYRSLVYALKNDYDRAIVDLDEAVRLDPNNSFAFYTRGDLYAQKGEHDRAIEDYDAAIRLDPEDFASYHSRGNSYAEKGDQDRAIENYNEAIRLNPNDAFFYYRRGLAHSIKGDLDQSIKDYSEALRLDPNDLYSYNNLGYAYMSRGDHDAAIANFDAVIRIDEENVVGLHNRGIAYFRKGDHDRAIADYDKAARLSPDDPEILSNRGDAYAAKNDHVRALADYEAALKIDPAFASALTGREKSQPIVAAAAATQAGGRKRALVIGVDQYDNIDPLKAAVNDARSIARGLATLGFDVITGENLTYAGMTAKFVELERRIEEGDTVFFFFSGHGVSIATRNYLLPSDIAKVTEGQEALFEYTAFAADRLVERIRGQGARAVIMVLDACRDNPFGRAGVRSAWAANRGLDGMAPPEGVFVLFSAAANQTALDSLGPRDSNPNSVFTRIFMEEFMKPGAPIDDIAKATQVRVNDLARTAGKVQRPAYYDEIVGRFVLR